MSTEHDVRAAGLRSAFHDLVPPAAPGLADLAGRVGTVLDTARADLAVDGLGLLLLDADTRVRVVAWSGAGAAAFERGQRDLHLGPGIDVLGGAAQTLVPDLARDVRWSGLGSITAAEGIHGILSTPVTIGRGVVGTLDVLRLAPYEWSARDRGLTGMYAEFLALLLNLTVQGAAA